MSDPSQSILILGAGVFGLSTALHLARKGYKDVTVLDRQPYDKNFYDPGNGCDGASADINKVFRTTYGSKKEYQHMGLRALPIWREWTQTILSSKPEDLPEGLTPTDQLLYESGFMRLAAGKQLSTFHKESLEGIEADGRKHRTFMLHDEGDYARAKAEDEKTPGMFWGDKLRRFDGLVGGVSNGFLDTDAGFTRADKACVYALHLAKQAGVKFILDPSAGAFASLIEEGEEGSKKVLGVVTKDGTEHRADKVIVACGGWTASIVPQASDLLETTGGSVCYVDLPKERQDLWDKYGPEQFCTWSFQQSVGSSFGGFPRTNEGRLKFGFRAVKYTNYETHSVTGKRISVPRTRYSEDPLTNVPLHALHVIQENIRQCFPELAEIGITGTRMCWYTDSIDNDFIASYVPGYSDTLFIASGGSGHGFKFLPVLGHHFVNQLEKVTDEFTKLWKWRSAVPGELANGLEEGEAGPRVLSKVKLATEEDWKFT